MAIGVVDGGEPEEEPIYGRTYLPRKFKIGLATPDDNSVDVLTNDLEDDEDVGFDESQLPRIEFGEPGPPGPPT